MHWLKKMAAQGLIRPEVMEKISQETKLVKEALGPMPTELKNWLAEALKYTAIGAGGFLGKEVVERGLKTYDSNKAQNSAQTALIAVKATVLSNPKLIMDKEKASARFNEIAKIAPALSTNVEFMTRMVEKNLHSGLSSEDIQRLALLQSQHMSEQLKSSTLMPKLASENLGKMLADVYIVKEAAVTNWSNILKDQTKHMAAFAALTGGIAAISGAAHMVADKFKQKKLQATLEDTFRQAGEGDHPNAQMIRENPDQARAAFKTLTHFAPHVALDPLTTRSFLSQVLTYGGTAGGMNVENVKTLTEIQKNVDRSSRPGSFSAGFETGAKYTKELTNPGDAFRAALMGEKRRIESQTDPALGTWEHKKKDEVFVPGHSEESQQSINTLDDLLGR